jgi:hypothetical protein
VSVNKEEERQKESKENRNEVKKQREMKIQKI